MDIELKKEFSFVISERVIEIFKTMFGVDVAMIDDNTSSFDDDDLVSKMTMKEGDLDVTLRFAFKRDLLVPLLSNIYDPIMVQHESTLQDAVCEITNIVGGGLKKHMNESGYSLEMEIPSIDYGFEKYDEDDKNSLNIDFMIDGTAFLVDFKLDKNKIEKELK